MKKFYAIVAVVFALVLSYITSPWWSHATTELMVNSTIVKNYGGESKYLVFTSQGVFENTDTLYYFKFNSSDIQGILLRPGKYKVTYYGWRAPIISKYPNIINVEKIQ